MRSALDAYRVRSRHVLCDAILRDGRPDPALLTRNQHLAHGVAWAHALIEGIDALLDWRDRLDAAGRLGDLEAALCRLGVGEACARLTAGIPMSQTEIVRPADMNLVDAAASLAADPPVREYLEAAADPDQIAAVARQLADGKRPDPADLDDDLTMMRDQFGRFAAREVAPLAQRWHLDDVLIPDDIVAATAEMGVFGLTLPREHGGLDLGKQAMAVVTEELSRFHLATGSLATRAEIAGELISRNGTDEQKARFLPGIADGSILPTAVFTEPDTGSDLARLKTRAVRDGAIYRIHGAKTWATHGARSDLMTLLVRTDAGSLDHRGLSMMLAEKPRGTVDDPFPAPGMRGSEIPTLGYRGLKEYDIAFDGFEVDAMNLLGGAEGDGFRQLMSTFEAARIQTAARAVGVARSALDLGIGYALDRKQFGEPLIAFPRVAGKLARIAAETEMSRQLTMRAAAAKDTGRRSDVEAGMAKLLAARTAWAAADDVLQIHGGIGYALETPISRVLVDARILNIFEGAGEIQAQVIARGLVSGRN